MIVICTVIFLVTLALVSFAIRKVIYVSHKKHLFDEPSENRKIHKASTPNLGGVAIFAIMIFSASLFLPYTSISNINFITAAAVILFSLGLTDDLVGVNPAKKIWAQLLAALIIAIPAGIRFTSFHGLFGLHEIPYAISIILSVLFILLLINAFNLIDGINCLAGSLGLLASLTFATCFSQMEQTGYMYLAIAMAGCLSGFLIFNRTPAKIFMGDTGSLFLGFMMAVFSIHFIEVNTLNARQGALPVFQSAPAIVFALLIIPIFDTLRVFTLRISKGRSPFHADRNHVHHRLLDLRFSHMQATAILLTITLIFLSTVLLLPQLRTEFLFLIIISSCLVLNSVSVVIASRKKKSIPVIKTIDYAYRKQEKPRIVYISENAIPLRERHELVEEVKEN